MNNPKIDTEEEIEINSVVIEENYNKNLNKNLKYNNNNISTTESIIDITNSISQNQNSNQNSNQNKNQNKNQNQNSNQNLNQNQNQNKNQNQNQNKNQNQNQNQKMKKKEGDGVPKIEVLTIYFCLFLAIVAFSILVPIIPFYASEHFQANALQVGIIEAAYSFTQFISSLFFGVLSDKSFGRKKLLVISLFGLMIGLFVTSFSQTLLQLILFRGLTGFFGGLNSLANAMITDIVPIQYRAKYLGLSGAVVGFGIAIGPTIGSALSKWGLKGICYASSILAFFGFIFSLIFLKETYVVKKKMKFKQIIAIAEEVPVEGLTTFKAIGLLLKRPFLIRFEFAFIFSRTGYIGFFITYPLLCEKLNNGLNESNIGYIYMMNGFMLLIIQGGFIGSISKKIHLQTLVYVMVPFGGIMLFILPEATTKTTDIIVMFFLGISSAFRQPCIMSLISFTTRKTDKGTIMGITQSLGSLSRLIGPIAGGALFDVNYRLGFWISGICLIIAGLMICGNKIPFRKKEIEIELDNIIIEQETLPEIEKKENYSENEWFKSSDDF